MSDASPCSTNLGEWFAFFRWRVETKRCLLTSCRGCIADWRARKHG